MFSKLKDIKKEKDKERKRRACKINVNQSLKHTSYLSREPTRQNIRLLHCKNRGMDPRPAFQHHRHLLVRLGELEEKGAADWRHVVNVLQSHAIESEKGEN